MVSPILIAVMGAGALFIQLSIPFLKFLYERFVDLDQLIACVIAAILDVPRRGCLRFRGERDFEV